MLPLASRAGLTGLALVPAEVDGFPARLLRRKGSCSVTFLVAPGHRRPIPKGLTRRGAEEISTKGNSGQCETAAHRTGENICKSCIWGVNAQNAPGAKGQQQPDSKQWVKGRNRGHTKGQHACGEMPSLPDHRERRVEPQRDATAVGTAAIETPEDHSAGAGEVGGWTPCPDGGKWGGLRKTV